jgi:hypothetical protein
MIAGLVLASLLMTACQAGGPGDQATSQPSQPGTVNTPSAAEEGPTGGGNAGSPDDLSGSPFGIMIGSGGAPRRVIQAVKDLGVVYIRPLAIFLDKGDQCPECDLATANGLKLVLTVRANGEFQSPTHPPADLQQYKRDLKQVLLTYKPVIVNIENEMNWDHYWTGTPEQYLAELQAGCEVAHSVGVLCADGGLVSGLIAGLVAEDLYNSGQQAQALDYAQRTLARSGRQIRSLADVERGMARGAQELADGRQMLSGFKAAGADRVNFHWYVEDPQALPPTIQFLQRITGGLPVMSNEMGQHEADPDQIAAVLPAARAAGIKPIIWYSIDRPDAKGLFELNGKLRPNGEMFRKLVRGQ